MGANDTLRDEGIRHALHAADYDQETVKRIGRLLNASDDDYVDRLTTRVAKAKARGFDTGPATTKKLEEDLLETRLINATVYSGLHDELRKELGVRAAYEAEWAGTTLGKTLELKSPVNLPPATYLRQLVDNSPVDGHLLRSWTTHMGDARQARVEQAIRLGLVQGQTTDEIVARIRGTRAGRYEDGILQISRRSCQSLVLTASATIANNARVETYRRSGLVKALKWVSVLDTRTTAICQSRDGKIYPIDEEFPQPPAHVRCRSILIAVTKSFKELGVRQEEIGPGARASMDGQVPGDTDMEAWVTSQPPESQAEALKAKERAELFRSGKVTWNELFRSDGNYRTIDELRKREGVVSAGSAAVVVPEPEAEPEQESAVDTTAIDDREKAYVVERGLKTGVEHLVAYDERTGIVIERKKGKKSSVALSPDLLDAISNPANSIVIHHNHPGSSSLSLPDLVIAQRPGAKGIWAHAHNGSSFYGERGALPLQKATAQAISSSLQAALQRLVTAGTIPVNDAILLHNHLTWMALDRVKQIVYRAKLAGESQEAWKRNKEIYEKLLEELK